MATRKIPSKIIYAGTKGQLDRAGDVIRDSSSDSPEYEEALNVLNAWRTAHTFPLNTFQTLLRLKVKKFHGETFVAQRLKRATTIFDKLHRYPKMKLSRMQDIGGCRAVLSTVHNVKTLKTDFENSRASHELISSDDYIESPKDSGYRGVHLIYKYRSNRFSSFNGYQIEIQIRTQIQHLWATAVETVGTFIQHSLKSSQGPDEWLQFFKNVGSYFAELEKSPIVPGTSSGEDLKTKILVDAKRLNVREHLSAFQEALQTTESEATTKGGYYLLALSPTEKKLSVTSYQSNQLEDATEKYLETEKALKELGGQAVLVKADSLGALRKAYPNYYLDTHIFLRHLSKIGV